MNYKFVFSVTLFFVILFLQACSDQEFKEAICHDTSEDSFVVKLWCKIQPASASPSDSSIEGESYGCVDYDGGLDYYKASHIISGRDKIQSTDDCLDSHTVFEYYCFADKGEIYSNSKSFSCPYGCKAGACKVS